MKTREEIFGPLYTIVFIDVSKKYKKYSFFLLLLAGALNIIGST
jgi:hypothetical protein